VRFTPQAAFQALPDRWRKLAFLGLGGTWGLYLALRGLFTPLEVARLTGDTLAHVQAVARSLDPGAPGGHPIDQLSRYEIHGYLQSQLLKDIDMMSMAHSVEVRVPFLDPVLVSAVLASPPESRVDTTTPKPLLVKALGELLPPELVYRPKMTFTFPFAEWVKQDLEFTSITGVLSREAVVAVERDFRSGRATWARRWALRVVNSKGIFC
jgi:asparagine synthase (glutamine-hydrolysing)